MTEQKKTQSVWKSYRFPILLISSIIIGSIIGLVMGEKATVLKPFGDIFLNLMFTAIVPLVFATIASAIGNMLNMKRLGKILGSLLAVFVVTGLIAGVIIIFIVTIYPPAAGVHITMEAAGDMEAVKLSDAIVNALTVSDFSALLSRQNMLPLIIFSIMFGFCISACGGKESAVGQVVNNLADIMMKIVNIIMMYAPIGLGAYFANLVGEFGPNLLGAYGRAMLVYYPVCAAYFVIFFSLYAYWAAGKDGFRRMWKFILPPAATSIATQSSVATLPVNLDAAKNIGVPKDIREIVLPLGATINMDGTAIYQGVCAVFIASCYGINLTLSQQIVIILTAVLASVGTAGVPGSGMIMLAMVLQSVGLPVEGIALVAGIDRLFDMGRTTVNITGDAACAVIVSHLEDKRLKKA